MLESSEFRWNPGQERARNEVLKSGARSCLIYGGSRSGKTFLLTGTILDRALYSPQSKHLITRQEAAAARASLARGNTATIPMMARLRYPGLEVVFNEKYGYFTLPNGSEIWIGGLNDEKAMERILGNEYATIYKNETSEIRYSAHTLLRSRLAQQAKTIQGDHLSQRDYNDLNPTTRNHWTYRIWRELIEPESGKALDPDQYRYCIINPYDNEDNLSSEYLEDLNSLPERARKRFMAGEYVEDDEDALWRRAMIRRGSLDEYTRIVVGVDPAMTSEVGSDETGIICAGVDANGKACVLADDSGKHRPEEWARRAIALYDEFGADRIVAEVNQGGDLVENNIRAFRPDVSYKSVHATRSKYVRAEPIAALYERGKVSHADEFSKLEDQMCSFKVDIDRKVMGSPDRVDALVWALSDLFPDVIKRKPAYNWDAPQTAGSWLSA